MTWEGELYLELHNGTYTTMAEHKLYNRHMETLLRDVELLVYLSQLKAGTGEDCHNELRQMWYTFLIDQFHDVLPGTCTELTVQDTRQNFKELKEKCAALYQQAIEVLLGQGNVKSVQRVRPAFDKVVFDPETEKVVMLNTSGFDRFERLTYGSPAEGSQTASGHCTVYAYGQTTIDASMLSLSSSKR